MARRKWWTLSMAVGVGLVLAGTGCGDGGGDEVSAPDTIDLLGAVEESGSARVSFVLDQDGLPEEGGDAFGRWLTRVELEGVVAFGQARSSFVGSFEMGVVPPEGAVDEVAAPLAWDVEMRTIGEESWTRETRAGEQGPWVREPGEDEFEPGGQELEEVEGEDWPPDEELDGTEGDDPFELLDPASFDPVGFVESLRGVAEDFTEEGSEEVRGDPALRYEVTLDPSIGEEEDWYGIDGRVEVWLDAQERLRRMRGGAVEMELWDFGVPVDVEPPADAVDFDEAEDLAAFGLPEVVGEWTVQAGGTTSGHAWQVFSAPARQADADITCRTLEVVGAGAVVDDWYGDEEGDQFSVPEHDGVPAACGAGLGGFFGGPADPALQVIGEMGFTSGSTGLVAFVVSERFRSGPVRIVFDGADPVELPLDPTGLAVWDGSGPATIVAVDLDGGSVRCPVQSMFAGGEPDEDHDGYQEEGYEGFTSSGAEQLWGGTAPCVRA